jgi:DNA-binding transcriptional LysR family regulator
VRVARSGSFTIAANQLGLSRALVSRHIGELEQRLGVRLLNRSTRSLHLTDEGRDYLGFCERVFADIESNERALVHARVEPAGTLKVAVPKSFGSLHLADAAIAFAQAQPKLRMALNLEDIAFHKPYEFVERGLDLALRISSQRSSSLIEEPIAMLDWLVCASPDYLSREGQPRHPDDLARHACLIHANVMPNDRIWRFETGGRVSGKAQSVKVNATFFSNSALALRKAAVAGLGIALLPRYSVAGDLADGTLLKIMPRYRVAQRPLFGVYPRAKTVPQKIRVFLDFMRDWIAHEDINDRRVLRG